MAERRHWVKVNRAAVLTAWAAVVAERLGFRRDEALTLGRAVAGLNAFSKGRRLGLMQPSPEAVKEARERAREEAGVERVELLRRSVPVARTDEGLRAVHDTHPTSPESVRRYLHGKLGDAFDDTLEAMHELARSRSRDDLRAEAYDLYEAFRPNVPRGKRGWGAEGRLSLDRIRKLANAS